MNTANGATIRKRFYHPELDALRGCAFLMVFGFHARIYLGLQPPSFLPAPVASLLRKMLDAGVHGVDLFFCLSAFLIVRLLLMELEATGTVDLRAFYARRILRIWPLFFSVLLVIQPLVSHFLSPGDTMSGSLRVAFLFFAGNFAIGFSGFPASFAGVLWSVSIEEQFYLVGPLLIRRWHSRLLHVCAAIAVLSFADLLCHSFRVERIELIYTDPLARILPILGGVVLAVTYSPETSGRHTTLTRWMTVALSWGILIFATRYLRLYGSTAWLAFVASAAASVLLVWSTLRTMNTWHPGPLGQLLMYIGKISYGAYALHTAFMVWYRNSQYHMPFATLTALIIAIALGSASYYGIERPFLLLKRKFELVRTRSV